MNQQQLLFVANWKMQFSFEQALTFCSDNLEELITLGSHANIVICPSFTELNPVKKILLNTSLAVGAQNCSQHALGAYTGEVSAKSLQQIGVTYCIVGHNERRMHYNETSHDIAQKVKQLLENKIQPIICIGETKDEYAQQKTFDVLQQQLDPIIALIQQKSATTICIAYEPIWSIGTGSVPTNAYLEQIFSWLKQILYKSKTDHTWKLLYGGSVDEHTVQTIQQVNHINGFLVGGASLDFQKFKNVVLLCNRK